MPDHMLNLPVRSLALVVALALAGLPAGSWAQAPKPRPTGGAASQASPKPPAETDETGSRRPDDKVMKVQTESEKAENEKEKAKPATGGNPPKPASSP
jgi:hypothetical protein